MSSNSEQAVLVIAGGLWQMPLIQFLQSKGHKVHVVDPYVFSPGVALADVHIQADVRDAPNVLNRVRGNEYAFVVTDQTDIAVDTVAYVSKGLGLPYIPDDVRSRFTDKSASRTFAHKIGMSIPAHARVQTLAEVQDMIKQVGGAVILKPADSQSSRGIQRCLAHDDNDTLQAKLGNCLAATRKPYVLAEEIVEGIEVTCEGFASQGKHITLAYSSKKHFSFGIASELLYPAQIEPELMKKVVAENDRYVEMAGLDLGITHAEYIVNPETGKFWLVEIACRGGGTLISSHTTSWVSGINLYEAWYQSLMGQKPQLESWKPQQRSAILRFFEFSSGKVKSMQGLDEVRAMPGVVRLDFSFKEGDTLQPAYDDRSRQGFILLFADDHVQLEQRLNSALETLKIEVG